MTSPQESPSLPRLVEAEHVAKRTGDTYAAGTPERNTVEDYIESVTAVVLDEGDASWSATTAPARVRVVVVDAVERRLNNPEQLTQRAMAGDLEAYATAADGWLTATELATVRRLAGKGAGAGAGAVVTSAQTRLGPERVAVMRSLWDEDEGTYYPTYVL